MQIIKNTYHLLQRLLAKYYLKLFPKIEIIGVTGSVGKTTTKEMIAAVLSEKFKVIATKGNLDPIYNIPLTIFKLRPKTQKLVVELSVDHFSDMDKYFWLVKPKIGVFTSIYWTHTEFLQDLGGVIKEKGKLATILPANGFLILNKDDQNYFEIAKKTKAKIIDYSLVKDACFYAKNLKEDNYDGISFIVVDKKNKKEEKIKLKLLGRQNVYNALAAIGVASLYGLSLSEMKKSLEKMRPLAGRMNLVELDNDIFLINDSYNASPLACSLAIETLAKLNLPGKRIAVLGEMKELGNYAETGHREVGRALVENNFDILIIFGQLTNFIADEARKLKPKIKVFPLSSIEEITILIKKIAKRNDLILLKGSRFAHMERIALSLSNKKVTCNLLTCQNYQNCQECKKLYTHLTQVWTFG